MLAPAPVRLVWRLGVRLAIAAGAVAVPWAFALLWVRPGRLTAALSLACATLTAVALAAAAAVGRCSDTREPSVAAGPAVLGAATFAALLPRRWALFAAPGDGWREAHARWAVVLAVAVALVLFVMRDPAAARSLRRTGQGGTAAGSGAAGPGQAEPDPTGRPRKIGT